MKITFVWDLYVPKEYWLKKYDSLQYFIYELAKTNEVSLLHKGNETFNLNSVNFMGLSTSTKIYEKLLEIKPDIIAIAAITASYFPIINLAKDIPTKKILMSSGGDKWNDFPEGYDTVIVEREYQKYYINHNNIVMVHNGADLEIFKPLNLEKVWDVICAADYRPIKRIDLLACILKSLNLSLLVNGCKNNANINYDNVTFGGRVGKEELSRNMNKSKIASLLSYSGDTAPRSISESMACGLPHITSEISLGIASIIREADAGLVVPDSELRNAFKTLINDEKRMKEFGRNARKYAEANFSYEKIVKQYKEIFFEKRRYND